MEKKVFAQCSAFVNDPAKIVDELLNAPPK